MRPNTYGPQPEVLMLAREGPPPVEPNAYGRQPEVVRHRLRPSVSCGQLRFLPKKHVVITLQCLCWGEDSLLVEIKSQELGDPTGLAPQPDD